MNAREWRPGDVAHLAGLGMAMYQGSGTWTRLSAAVRHPTNVRPLVVIDPEDPEQVKRLDDLLTRFLEDDAVPDYEGTEGVTAAALREFASPTPPKPPEPQGLGAVVEDAKGQRWVRIFGPAETPDYQCWKPDIFTSRSPWSEVDAVRVLSEGVTP